MSATPRVVGAVELGGEWELPPIGELFNFRPFPGTEDWGVFAFNRVSLYLLLSVVLIGGFYFIALSKSQIVPGRLQSMAEAVIDFVQGIAVSVIGEEGKKYVPFLTTLFLFVLVNNFFKLTPLINLPTTGRMAIPALLAGMVWLIYVVVGMRKQGVIGYFKEMMFPPGVPAVMYIILAPIELLSNLVMRPVTLALRLFANMVAGHILVVLTLITVHAFIRPDFSILLAGVGLVLSPVVFGFELFVIVLQAYIFTMLAAVYISASEHPAH